MIDWSNPNSKLSKWFIVGEALYLPQILTLHVPTEEEKQNIINMAIKMDLIRELLDTPIKVHVWIRPTEYNTMIGGSKKSAHINGMAVDFSTKKYTIDQIMDILQPKCSELQIAIENNGSLERIEKNGGKGPARNWIHAQSRPLVIEPRYRIFNP